MGDKPTEITPIKPEPQTQESPPPEWMLQILVNQFGLSPPQAQAYIDTVAHPSHSVAQGNVVTAAKLRMAQQAALVNERDRLLNGLPSQDQIDGRERVLKGGPGKSELERRDDLMNSPQGEIQMPAINAHTGAQAQRASSSLGPRMRSGIAGLTPHDPPSYPTLPSDANNKRHLSILASLAMRGGREGVVGAQSWLPGSTRPTLGVGDVSTQSMPIDIGDVDVSTAPPSLDIGDVTVKSKRGK